MIRITAGKFKNRKIQVPETAEPLMDRMRLSLFDLLREFITDANVLDLYAGSGVTGLEALSRGAKFCLFVEKNQQAVEIIKKNIQNCGVGDDQAKTVTSTVAKYLKDNKAIDKFELIFVDPPFVNLKTLDLDQISPKLNPSGIIIAKLPKDFVKRGGELKSTTLTKIYKKSYGGSDLVFFQ